MSGRKMPKFTKAPPALVAAFDDALKVTPKAQRRLMFGYPAAFVNGNMFAGVFGDAVFVRLGPEERPASAKPFAPMRGRPMKDYVVVPQRDLSRWIARSFRYASTLPPKTKK